MDDQRTDPAVLRTEMNLGPEEIDRRKAWLALGDEDVVRLARIDELVGPHVDKIVGVLVDELLVPLDGAAPDRETSRRLLRDYFGGLTGPDGFSDSYVERRLGMVHDIQKHLSADVSWYLAAFLAYLHEVGALLRGAADDVGTLQEAYHTLGKVVFLDLSLAIDAHVHEGNRTIRAQRRELEELSTPVLQLREGLLLLPIVGVLDSRRARQLTQQLLYAIRDRRGKVVVLDVTGVATVDSGVANHLMQTIDAARLMGAKAVITGVSPEVAQTLVALGISLGNVTTIAELQGGVDEADRVLGLRVVRVEDLPGNGRQR